MTAMPMMETFGHSYTFTRMRVSANARSHLLCAHSLFLSYLFLFFAEPMNWNFKDLIPIMNWS